MRICPKCQRSYDDELSFCLEDGSLLISPRSESKTEIYPKDFSIEENIHSSSGKRKVKIFALASFFLIAVGGLAGGLIYFYKTTQSPVANTQIQTKTPTPRPTILPNNQNTKIINSNINSPNGNLQINTNQVNAPINTNTPLPSNQTNKNSGNTLPTTTVPKLKKGMTYRAARKILLDNGWQPAKFPSDRELFNSMQYLIEKYGFNEVENCSGTGMGYCLFVFNNKEGDRLEITTTNNEEIAGEEPIVFGWRLEKK